MRNPRERIQGIAAGLRPRRRRRLLVVLAVGLVGLGVALALRWSGGASQEDRAERARVLLRRGGPTDLRNADAELTAALASGPDNACLHAAQDLLRAHLWVEYGLLPDAAITEGGEEERGRCRDARITDGLLAFASGDLAAAEGALAAAEGAPTRPSLAPSHHTWLAARIALAGPEPLPPERLEALEAGLAAAIREDPESAAYRRLEAELRLRRGDVEGALAALARARELSRTHLGLAADEALYLASRRRELSSVADLADQLLALDPGAIGPYDRGRAILARAIVHLHSGEVGLARRRLEEAWTILPAWDHLARRLALDLSLETGESGQARAWIAEAALDPTSAAVYRAWADLVDGEVMTSLAALAELPQREPRVAYLQALALVEQQRLAEAGPWVARALQLFPGWVELEVASARVAVAEGDRAAALRRLQGLAEEESYAPRAWTGLGEAYLAHARDRAVPDALPRAHKALRKAVEREPRPAEAMLRLGEVWQQWRRTDPEGERRALEWLEKAAQTAPSLPRYRLALARYLVDIGEYKRAEGLLRELIDAPGVDAQPALVLAHLALEEAVERESLSDEFDGWLKRARELGADEDALLRLEARAALVTGRRGALTAMKRALAQRVEALADDVELRVLYARTLMALREDEEALTIVRRGIYGEEDGDGRLFLALAELELRDAKRKQAALHARAAWNRLRESERPTVELLAAADLGARLFVQTEAGPQALALVRDLTRHLPLHADAWRIRARTELALNEASDARRSIEKAVTLAPENAKVHGMRAQILLRFGARPRAKEAYARAIELAEGTPDAERWRTALKRL